MLRFGEHAIGQQVAKPYCIVREWMLIEIEVTNEYRESVAGDGCNHACSTRPASLPIVRTGGRLESWIRSAFQRSFTDSYGFEMSKTLYILMGPGQRKRSNLQGSCPSLISTEN
ncbi:DUF6957 family protein [Pseudomonas sp. JUb42]|uniref:DUF6957 family protein n=1 Tax=Pseudomonas sp. JUb42 TaxID=2940611 RepID=UPI0038F7C3A4